MDESFIAYDFEHISLAVLTWRSPKTLNATLASISEFRSLFKNCYVVCQDNHPVEVELAIRYGFIPVGLDKNIGIQEGLAHCAQIATTPYVLIMENDCKLEHRSCFRPTIHEGVNLLKQRRLDIVKLGTIETGNRGKYTRYWTQDFPPRRRLRAYLRPDEARSYCGNAIYLDAFPASGTNYVTRLSDHIYVTQSAYTGWTNRAFMIEREFFLHTIINFARQNPARHNVNGLPDLEKELNSPQNRNWWRTQSFRIGIARPGLFGHHRLDRNRDDEKY